MFGFGKKTKAPKWGDLTDAQRASVTRRFIKALGYGGARYKIVSGSDERQRERGITEREDEDQILSANGRGKALNMARNLIRNSSTFNAILKQFELNVIGGTGGKVIFPEKYASIKDAFATWTRSGAEFFDGLSLNSFLRLILKEYLISGDLLLLFDGGQIENSGKILLFESDEIGNLSKENLEKYYGKSATQSLGRVYSPNGRFIGAVCSRSQRGAEEFKPELSFLLKRDPNESPFENFWMMPRSIWRVSQGRGITPLMAALGALDDVETLAQSELAAAKRNAQVLA